MQHRIAIVKNVAAVQVMYESLAARAYGVPGIGLIHGETGFGKTTSVSWLVNRVNGIYVRVYSNDTTTTLMRRILAELGIDPSPGQRLPSQMTGAIVEQMAIQDRPLFDA